MKNRTIVEDTIYKHIQMLDPSGTNTNRYKKMFSEMNDSQFQKYMEDLRDKKVKLLLYVPNMKVVLKMEDILKTARSLKLDCFERLQLVDSVTKKKYLTTQKYLVVKLPIRRARQFLMHKLSVGESDKKTDTFTGQVTGPDKSASLSFVEAQLLYSRGLNKVLEEFVKVRGGDLHAYSNLKQQLEESGNSLAVNEEHNTTPRSAVVAHVVLTCMGLKSNLVEGL